MGNMLGYVKGRTLVVTDAFALPVEASETRVTMDNTADEYKFKRMDLNKPVY